MTPGRLSVTISCASTPRGCVTGTTTAEMDGTRKTAVSICYLRYLRSAERLSGEMVSENIPCPDGVTN